MSVLVTTGVVLAIAGGARLFGDETTRTYRCQAGAVSHIGGQGPAPCAESGGGTERGFIPAMAPAQPGPPRHAGMSNWPRLNTYSDLARAAKQGLDWLQWQLGVGPEPGVPALPEVQPHFDLEKTHASWKPGGVLEYRTAQPLEPGTYRLKADGAISVRLEGLGGADPDRAVPITEGVIHEVAQIEGELATWLTFTVPPESPFEEYRFSVKHPSAR